MDWGTQPSAKPPGAALPPRPGGSLWNHYSVSSRCGHRVTIPKLIPPQQIWTVSGCQVVTGTPGMWCDAGGLGAFRRWTPLSGTACGLKVLVARWVWMGGKPIQGTGDGDR